MTADPIASITIAILAGGHSSRMGIDKSLMPINGQPLIQHIVDQLWLLTTNIIISTNTPERHAFLGLPMVADEQSGFGPIMGILSCLAAIESDHLLVTPCDVPVLPLPFLLALAERSKSADIVMATDRQGRHEPLLAIYARRLEPLLRHLVNAGERRIVTLVTHPGIHTEFISLAGQDWYRNLNTPADL